MTRPTRIAQRMDGIAPFHVMDLLARARAMEAQGRSVIHMEIGEPDFATPEPIIEAGRRALAEGHTHYTPALGLPALREAIASYYATRYGVEIDPDRVVVTPGASGAFLVEYPLKYGGIEQVNAVARKVLSGRFGAAVLGPHRSKGSLPQRLRAMAG